ncbi:aspartyl protease AED1-like [Spinacia oleracea]|uniref:Aspartyl protease AED1-like n=1 Tax=Spinacia oleracea TaxID=3562 RepID=A0A9R0JV16_SPIOL|nr:aspartyl protease AED1-like [Spinacia oleracea]
MWACGFKSVYGGGASTFGLMGTDTFLFINAQTKKPDFFFAVAFGCGLKNQNFDFGLNTGPNNLISGIFGLAPGPQSFLNQLDGITQGRFSYCLTSWVEPDLGMSTIHFGPSAQLDGPNVQEIHMNAKDRYHLFLRGISVDGKRLPIHPSICTLDQSQGIVTKGFFIDSGAPYTLLPTSAYQPLRAAIVDYFSRYGWRAIGQRVFDLCYLTGPRGSQTFPSVVFHFAGTGIGAREVDWVMDKDNMFVKIDSGGDGFCMVVGQVPDPGPCLFGAYQQANFRILYDVKNWILRFAPDKCQENRPLYDRSDMIRYAQKGAPST